MLDDTPDPASETASTEAGAAATPVEPASSGNAWVDMQKEMGAEFAEHADPAPAGEGEAKPKAGEPAPAGGVKAAGAAAETAATEGKGEPTGGEPAKDLAPPRFTIVDKEGQEFDLEPIPEGAVITVRADRKTVRIDSWDKAFEYVQKGVNLDRVASQQGQQIVSLKDANTALQRELDEADQAFQTLIDDDDALERYRDQARKQKARESDPEYQAGKQAEQEVAARKAADAETGKQAVAALWDEVANQFEKILPDHPFLDESDLPAAQQAFYQDFLAQREIVAKELAPQSRGMSEVEFTTLVDKKALEWIHEDRFRDTVGRMNDRYARRAGRGKAPTPAETPQQKAEREAAAHNARTDKRVAAARAAPRTVRTGAPPAPVTVGEQPRPRSWKEHMAGIKEEFTAAKSGE